MCGVSGIQDPDALKALRCPVDRAADRSPRGTCVRFLPSPRENRAVIDELYSRAVLA
jgi:hypothetical protein